MTPDAIEPKDEPEAGSQEPASPETVLEFLSQHRQGAERRHEPQRRIVVPGGKTALLGIVAALVVAGATVGVIVWGTGSRAADNTPTSTSPSQKGHGKTAKGKSSKKAGRKKQRAAANGGAGEPWQRGLQPWPASAAQGGPPTIYYQLRYSHGSCAKRAPYGCWKVRVATRYGCPNGVMVFLGETRHGADLGAAFAVTKHLAPRKTAVVELDAHERGVSGQVRSMLCKT